MEETEREGGVVDSRIIHVAVISRSLIIMIKTPYPEIHSGTHTHTNGSQSKDDDSVYKS